MTPLFSIVASPIAKLWQIPLVTWYTHETVTLPLRFAEKLSDKIFTASKESFRLHSRKVLVTNHGIDTNVFIPREHASPRPELPVTICSIGRISPRKDYETLIRAVDLLVHKEQLSEIRVVIIGNEGTRDQKSYMQKIVDMVKNSRLESHIEFVGSIPHREIAHYYQQSDIFVNMRQTGGMDKAVLEAMACEIPTVVCNRTFVPLFGRWAEQLMFEERNATILADRLGQLIRLEAEQRKEIGQDLRSVVVQEHNLDNLMDRLVGIFKSL
jgi:glycosyltransferase involved in cell wall biosynthesis